MSAYTMNGLQLKLPPTPDPAYRKMAGLPHLLELQTFRTKGKIVVRLAWTAGAKALDPTHVDGVIYQQCYRNPKSVDRMVERIRALYSEFLIPDDNVYHQRGTAGISDWLG